MKPTKNRVFCKNCGRSKILFETEKKAQNFIKFNSEEIEAETGYSPQRVYYCVFCGGWHTTSMKETRGTSRNEHLFEEYQKQKQINQENKKQEIEQGKQKIGQKTKQGKQKIEQETQIKQEKKEEEETPFLHIVKAETQIFETQTKDMSLVEKEGYLNEKIQSLDQEIAHLVKNNVEKGDKYLKYLRRLVGAVQIIRKQHKEDIKAFVLTAQAKGETISNEIQNILLEKELKNQEKAIDEWAKWAKERGYEI